MSEPMKHSRFWMVYNPQGRGPTHKHWSRELADREATRLAKMNPGQDFFVLKTMAGFRAEEAPVVSIEITKGQDDIPF